MPATQLGGGRPQKALITVRTKLVDVVARYPVFDENVGVVISEGRHAGCVIVRVKKAWQCLPDVYSAVRQAQIILLKYGQDFRFGEKHRMIDAMVQVRHLVQGILDAPGQDRAAFLQRTARQIIDRAAQHLGRPSSVTKREALELLESAVKVRDGRGRSNPSSAAAQGIASLNRLRTRLEEEVLRIDPKIKSRQHALLAMIQEAEMWLELLDEFALAHLQQQSYAALSSDRARASWASMLRFYIAELKRIDFHPFHRTVVETVKDLERCGHLLTFGPWLADAHGEFTKLVANCRAAVEMKRIQMELERVVYILTSALHRPHRQPPLEEAQRRLVRIEERLGNVDEKFLRNPGAADARRRVQESLALFHGDAEPGIETLRGKLLDASETL